MSRVHRMEALVLRGWTAISRILVPAGTVAQQADISSIQCTVKRDGTTAGGTQTYDSALTVSSVIFDTLQNDDRWDADTTGYNFLFEIPGSAFPVTDNYRIDFTFTPASGEKFSLQFEGPAKSTFN